MPRKTAIWMAAARPNTLPAAVAPVMMGTALAARDGVFHVWAAVAALVGALCIQVGTNFANDYFDHKKGTDTGARIGPARATAMGWVTPAAMKRATVVALALALLVGAYLVWLRGWPMAVLGLVSLVLAVLYTGGPKPLAYVGLGDLFVLAFFGPLAVAGTYFAQSGLVDAASIVAGVAPGCLSTALLTVNNLRDADQDRAHGKMTLAARFGRRFAKREYALLIVAAAVIPIVLIAAFEHPRWMALASLPCFLAVPIVFGVARASPGDALLEELAATGKVLVLFALVFGGVCLWA